MGERHLRFRRLVPPAIILLLFLAADPLLADVGGRVATATGQPVEGALVLDPATGVHAVTDARGQFRLRGVEPPLTLVIEDVRFETLTAEVGRDEGEKTFALQPKQAAFEKVIVTAYPVGAAVAPVSASATAVDREELPAPAGTLVEMAAAAPGVADSGQGGRFQAYSVRGVAGQRVFTTVAGMRIVTERRAGATASFIDPALLGSVEVVRGPGSTFYGSGALGGVVQALPRRLDGAEVEVGYASQGDERNVFAGWGGDGFSAALAGRDAADGENGDGEFLFNHSTQWSGLVRKEWTRASWSFDLLAMPAVARDIAKPNTRYPERITDYPEENHLLLRLEARNAAGWRYSAFVHPNDLETQNVRSSERSLLKNEAFDFGADAQRALKLGEAWNANFGVEYFGRADVTASENERSRTLDGSEGQLSLFGSVRRPLGRATLEGGARATRIDQENLGAESDDTAGAGFIGATLRLGAGFELAANVGTGSRFPSLSERFFTGSTGRGEVLANQDLDPERSQSADLGLRYFGSRLFNEVFAFRNEIDDYIEQFEVAPDVESFVNLTSGTIDGLDLDGWYAVTEHFKVTWAGTSVRGESDGGADLADIPADRGVLGARFDGERWRAAGSVERRLDKSDAGFGELPIEAASLLSASLSWRARQGYEVRAWGKNLLDETYQPSADELAVAGPGRAVGLTLRWIER